MSKFTEFLASDGEKVSIDISKVTAAWRDDNDAPGIITIRPSGAYGTYDIHGMVDDIRRQVGSYGHHTIPFVNPDSRESGFFVAEKVVHYLQRSDKSTVFFGEGKIRIDSSYEDVKKSIDDALGA